ncbi:MAG: hypothetical protein AMXMBFR20_23870 [Planctomycetia bacterium]
MGRGIEADVPFLVGDGTAEHELDAGGHADRMVDFREISAIAGIDLPDVSLAVALDERGNRRVGQPKPVNIEKAKPLGVGADDPPGMGPEGRFYITVSGFGSLRSGRKLTTN